MFALALGAALALPSYASAQTPIVLEATIPEGTPRYFAVPFTVPEGIREIEVRHDDMSEMNILDWGLADPSRFRGWGGGNSEPAVVAADRASRSYLAGPIAPGAWSLLIGQAKVIERPARYRVEIFLRAEPTLAAQPERRPYTASTALSTGPRWYAGDFHVHSRESGDAAPTLDATATFARGRGLDFIELSEHNTVSQLDLVSAAQARHPDLLFLPGIEVTTYGGHANAIGATQWVDFRVGSAMPAVTLGAITESIAAQGALFAINHPTLDLGDTCIGCSWSHREPPGSVSAIEVQNGQYSVTGVLFYPQTVEFWESYLARGEHVAPIGGSDDHRAGNDRGAFASPIGGPTTMVYATELSVSALVAGVRAGHTVVKLQGPGDPMVDLRANDAAMVGDTVRASRVTLRATVTGGVGAALNFVHNGETLGAIDVTSDPFTATREVSAPAGSRDDRWRCELSVNGRPRVLTGHVWVAASGVADAGVVSPAPTPDGCGCRAQSDSPKGAWGALLAMVLGLVRRRQRPSRRMVM
jgi:MYXO-CTERM domain-containing protein